MKKPVQSAPRSPEPRAMTSADVAWLRMDNPVNLMMINGVLVFQRRVEKRAVERLVEKRLLPIDRFRQRVRAHRGRPAWVEADSFRLGDHVEEVELPAPGGEAELRQLISRLMSEELHPGRPLWHFLLVQGYDGGSALVGRLHHCIGDGIALMLVLLSLTDVVREPAENEPGNPFQPLFQSGDVDLDSVRGATERLMPDGMKLLLQPVEAFGAAKRWKVGAGSVAALGKLLTRRKDPKTVFKGGLGGTKRAAWSRAIEMDEVRGARAGLGGTVNDVLLTAMTGGLRRYIVRRGQSPDGVDFHAAVPVNLRPLERMADLGNEFGLVFLGLPVGVSDPVARLQELRRRMQGLKRSAEPVAILGVLRALGRVHRRIQRSVIGLLAPKVTAVMTNVPGPARPLYFAGERIDDIFFWVPQSGDVGLGVSILSYAGKIRLGVMTDFDLVPDPEAIVEEFEREWDAMLQLANAAGA